MGQRFTGRNVNLYIIERLYKRIKLNNTQAMGLN